MTADEHVKKSARPRGAFQLLTGRDFGGFFWGRLVTASAVYLHSVVAAIVVYGATGSVFAVALVPVAQFAPQLLLALVAGAWADRGDVARQIIFGRLLCAAGSGGLGLWLSVDDDATGWVLASVVVAASLIAGFGFVIGGPAMQSVTPLLVRRDELPTAMALNTAPMTVGRVAGPAVGAVMTQLAGPAQAFAAAAAGHLLFAGLMLIIRIPDSDRTERGVDESYSVAAAVRHVWHDRPLLLLLVVVAGLGFGSEPTATLAPALARDLGGGAGTVGALTSSFGAGAGLGIIVSSWMAPRVRHEVVVSVGIMLLAVGVAGCAAAITVELAMLAMAAAGGGFIVASSSAGTLIQLRVPGHLRGRVMALWMMGFVGARPVAAVVSGAVADGLSVRAAWLVVAACLVAIAAWCRPRSLV
ncbi:MFS transporter [Streptomyces sp. NPDC050433]|uniref:MFS transporter n=1 Tax=Streptomyces sp. NPDC050433 TaxID=3365615 RepID=UPI0037BB09C6